MSVYPPQSSPVSSTFSTVDTPYWKGLPIITVSAPSEHIQALYIALTGQVLYGNPGHLDNRFIYHYVHPQEAQRYVAIEVYAAQCIQYSKLSSRYPIQEEFLLDPETPIPVQIKSAEDLYNAKLIGAYVSDVVSIERKNVDKYRVAFLLRKGRQLGSGNFGTVYQVNGVTLDAKNLSRKEKPHVIKIIRKGTDKRLASEIRGSKVSRFTRQVIRETGGNVSGFVEPGRLHLLPDGVECIITKEYQQGTLAQFITNSSPSLDALMALFRRPYEMLSYFSIIGVQYFDLKMSNLWINGNKMAIGDSDGSYILLEVENEETADSFLEKITPGLFDSQSAAPPHTLVFTRKDELHNYAKRMTAHHELVAEMKTWEPEKRALPLDPSIISHYRDLRTYGTKILALQMGIVHFLAVAEETTTKNLSNFFTIETTVRNGETKSYFSGIKEDAIREVFGRPKVINTFGKRTAGKLHKFILSMLTNNPADRIDGEKANIRFKELFGYSSGN